MPKFNPGAFAFVPTAPKDKQSKDATDKTNCTSVAADATSKNKNQQPTKRYSIAKLQALKPVNAGQEFPPEMTPFLKLNMPPLSLEGSPEKLTAVLAWHPRLRLGLPNICMGREGAELLANVADIGLVLMLNPVWRTAVQHLPAQTKAALTQFESRTTKPCFSGISGRKVQGQVDFTALQQYLVQEQTAYAAWAYEAASLSATHRNRVLACKHIRKILDDCLEGTVEDTVQKIVALIAEETTDPGAIANAIMDRAIEQFSLSNYCAEICTQLLPILRDKMGRSTANAFGSVLRLRCYDMLSKLGELMPEKAKLVSGFALYSPYQLMPMIKSSGFDLDALMVTTSIEGTSTAMSGSASILGEPSCDNHPHDDADGASSDSSVQKLNNHQDSGEIVQDSHSICSSVAKVPPQVLRDGRYPYPFRHRNWDAIAAIQHPVVAGPHKRSNVVAKETNWSWSTSFASQISQTVTKPSNAPQLAPVDMKQTSANTSGMNASGMNASGMNASHINASNASIPTRNKVSTSDTNSKTTTVSQSIPQTLRESSLISQALRESFLAQVSFLAILVREKILPRYLVQSIVGRLLFPTFILNKESVLDFEHVTATLTKPVRDASVYVSYPTALGLEAACTVMDIVWRTICSQSPQMAKQFYEWVEYLLLAAQSSDIPSFQISDTIQQQMQELLDETRYSMDSHGFERSFEGETCSMPSEIDGNFGGWGVNITDELYSRNIEEDVKHNLKEDRNSSCSSTDTSSSSPQSMVSIKKCEAIL